MDIFGYGEFGDPSTSATFVGDCVTFQRGSDILYNVSPPPDEFHSP